MPLIVPHGHFELQGAGFGMALEHHNGIRRGADHVQEPVV